MRERSIFVIFLVLVLNLSFVVPGRDVPETAFDESGALPYASTLPLPILGAALLAPAPQAVPMRVLPLLFAALTKRCERRRGHWAGPAPSSDLDQSLCC